MSAGGLPPRDPMERIAAALEKLAEAQAAQARGCVCPAGAERGCRGLSCPRRDYRDYSRMAPAHDTF
jgi:hypothetical protein